LAGYVSYASLLPQAQRKQSGTARSREWAGQVYREHLTAYKIGKPACLPAKQCLHASSQDNVSRQTHFSFHGHHMACPLTLVQYQATSSGATSKAGCKKHVLSILMT